MKRILIILAIFIQVSQLSAQEGKRFIKKGNELYKKENYAAAEESYRKSVSPKNQQVEAEFNLGDALYKQKKFADARTHFSQIAATEQNDKVLKAQAYHNLGNAFLSEKKLEEGIAAYKNALINNPKDDETRYNLAYAQEMLKKQQQQNKDNKDKNKDKKQDQQGKDDKKNQQDKDNKKEEDKNKNQDKKDQDQKNQDKDQKDEQKDQQKTQPGQLSKEDAQRMLDAMNNKEKETQEKLKKKKFIGQKTGVTKDW